MVSAINNNNSMKVVDQFQVSPPPTPSERPPLPLTFFDIMWIFQSPVERVFLFDYPYPTSHFIQSHLPNLKSSLSLTLATFYPLAGKLQPCPDSEDRFELRYEPGDSVTLTVLESDGGGFLDFKGSHARDFSKLRSLAPQLGKPEVGGPLIAIQVTVFPNHGVAVGLAAHHVACDGHSSVNFIKSWAAAFRSARPVPNVEHPPVYDRTATVDPFGVYERIFKAMQALKPDPSAASPDQPAALTGTDLVIAALTLTSNDIGRLKELVEAKKPLSRVSAFVVSCAYVWVCLAKLGEYMSDRCSQFVFMVDWRGRMEPPVERSYFGNCVWPCFAEVKAEDLIGEDGVVAAAEAIGAAIQEDLTEGLAASMERAFRKTRDSMPRQPISVAGSPKFGVYDVDFGWGRAEKVEVVSIRDAGAISLSESREERGVQVGLVLPRKEMEEFTAHFVGGLRLRS